MKNHPYSFEDPLTLKENASPKAIFPKPEGYVARPPRDTFRDSRGGRHNRGRYNHGLYKHRDDREAKKE